MPAEASEITFYSIFKWIKNSNSLIFFVDIGKLKTEPKKNRKEEGIMLRVSELVNVLKLKQALNIPLDEGACFGVSDSSKLRPPFKSLTMKEVFIVDGNLRITPVKIPASVWEHKSRIFTAEIDSMPVIVLRGGWNKWTTYAAFETEQEAKDFKKAVKSHEQRRLAEKRKARKNPYPSARLS